MLEYWIAACCSPSTPVGRNFEDRVQKQLVGCDRAESPASLSIDQQRSLCSGIFAERVDSDGARLEVTLLEAAWRTGKTDRAEDHFKMTQDGPEAETWTDFEEDGDAVNQARA